MEDFIAIKTVIACGIELMMDEIKQLREREKQLKIDLAAEKKYSENLGRIRDFWLDECKEKDGEIERLKKMIEEMKQNGQELTNSCNVGLVCEKCKMETHNLYGKLCGWCFEQKNLAEIKVEYPYRNKKSQCNCDWERGECCPKCCDDCWSKDGK